MKDSINPNSLFQNINGPSAPVDDWDPPYCGEIDICIHRDGHWSYNGSDFSRPALVKMFARVLKRENDNYYLVTPIEKVKITVEAEPFITTLVERNIQNAESYAFKTNMDETIIAGNEHPIIINEDQKGQPYPTILIRKNLNALISRSDYYQLVDWSTTETYKDKNRSFIISNNHKFTLGIY